MAADTDPSARQRLLFLGGLMLALYLAPLTVAHRIPLLDPDEGIHASVSQEMVRGGDWICPRFVGEPFRDKPILFFWAQAASLALLGMNEAAVRMPGMVFAILGAVTTGVVARRFFGITAGWIAALFQTTMVLPAALAQSPVHDLALVPLTNLALLGFWNAERQSGAASGRGVLLAGAMLGLAALTKGLLGVALVACPAVVYLLLARRMRWSIAAKAIAALAIGAAVAAPWYLAMSVRVPGYAHYFFIERHIYGFATDTQMHGDAPWWYYLPLLAGGGLPWIAYLPLAAWQGWIDRRVVRDGVVARDQNAALGEAGRARLLAWCWLLVSFLFLSAAHSKLVTYLLPAFPAIAVLAADVWARCSTGHLRPDVQRWLWRIFIGSSLSGALLLPFAMYLTEREFSLTFPAWMWALCVAASCGSWLPLWRFAERSIAWRLGAGSTALACCLLFVMTCLMPRVAPCKSAIDLARHFNEAGRLPPRLLIAEERIGSFVFYLEPKLRNQLTADRVASVRVRELAADPQHQPGTLLTIPERSMRRGEHYLGLGEAPFVRAGRYRVFDAADARPQPPLAARPHGRGR